MKEEKIDRRRYNMPTDEIRSKIDYESSHTGNTWGVSIKDPNERQIAFQSYCDHLSKGYSKMTWSYSNDKTGSHWTYHTCEKWIKDSNEFNIEKKQIAQAQGLKVWEQKLMDSAFGRDTKCNVASLQIGLRNRGYENPLNRDIDIGEIALNYERVMLLLAEKQKTYERIENKELNIIEDIKE